MKNFRAAETRPGLDSGSSDGSFPAPAGWRWYEGRVEKPCVVAGHSVAKSLIGEFVAKYRSDLGVAHVLLSEFDVEGVRSRPQRTCEVLSSRSVSMFSIL